MMLSKYIPDVLFKMLWGDRKRSGVMPNSTDCDWQKWERCSSAIYMQTQQRGIGDKVCNMAYNVMIFVDVSDRKILEIGPGNIRHLQLLCGRPQKYTICDIRNDFLDAAARQLSDAGIPYEKALIRRNTDRTTEWQLPFGDESFDIVISFYSLEHLYPLDSYIIEIRRILKRGGQLVGGIPCEGGLAWGLGRFLTTRRYVRKNYSINYDKIICWEHPNFADYIIERLDTHFERQYLRLHPFHCLPMDLNLVASFIYR